MVASLACHRHNGGVIHDLIIIGGGINGCAIAREAAINGLSVLLVERDDIASHTSSASTGLIHGGLRYLEYREFRLVREALQERERLLHAAPHLIAPMRFVLPHEHSIRPWWLVRLGLLLYDRLGGRISLPRSRGLRRDDSAYRAPLRHRGKGFVYSDCRVDDARLTLANALDAAQHGAAIRTRTAAIAAQRSGATWQVALSDGTQESGRALVNAAGPWVAETLGLIGVQSRSGVRLIRGSHIIVPRLYEGDHAYMLQQPDRRIVFALPYQRRWTVIGTTDIAVDRPEDAGISPAETAYLCAAASSAFTTAVTPTDIIASYSGVRSLYDDGASESRAVTRDYVLELDRDGPPALSVFGGKITTARHLAETAFDRLAPAMGWMRGKSSRGLAFPGGDIADFAAFLADVAHRWPFLGAERALRMARAYGTMLHAMLAQVASEAQMGMAFGAGFTEIEAHWMHEREFALTAQDCLMRRSKLGLAMTDKERAAFRHWWNDAYLSTQPA
ncbi:glycerol-3-phosphate dehydrogenase [Sphingobium aquiterrae]|uniref:glycerol-3-phosphate dehydrogenase n=1 Tax=Sphingobium aquiterrae TaxID=2038656 RepID=UPI00301B35B6